MNIKKYFVLTNFQLYNFCLKNILMEVPAGEKIHDRIEQLI